jgi:hypothetical protein
MMRNRRCISWLACAAISAAAALTTRVDARSDTVFTYQGELRHGGSLANGLYDLHFAMWDADTGGAQLGATVALTGVAVVDGRFTVPLDFGAEVFDNSERWMEITVDGTMLSPRQRITRAPYSIQTRGIFVDEGGKVGIGTTAPASSLEIAERPDQHGIWSTSAWIPVHARRTGTSGTWPAVDGECDSESDEASAVRGLITSTSPGAYSAGVRGVNSSTFPPWPGPQAHLGVYGTSDHGIGVMGTGYYGLVGQHGTPGAGYAIYSWGDCHVDGTLTKSGGSFKIDHPLDPEQRYLAHSFVESPDMMNVYNGNVVTDENGVATVLMPRYFEALNRDFRYQLTVIGRFARAIVAEEIANNRFVIHTDEPNVKVSWQVTGIRHDPWAEANRIEVEPFKRSEHVGRYLHPELYGESSDRSVHGLPDR